MTQGNAHQSTRFPHALCVGLPCCCTILVLTYLKVLLPAFASGIESKIKHFLVDATLPTPLFEALHRRDTGGGGKKGGKKRGKGKKK